jgi:hypothetical protein
MTLLPDPPYCPRFSKGGPKIAPSLTDTSRPMSLFYHVGLGHRGADLAPATCDPSGEDIDQTAQYGAGSHVTEG